MGIVIVVKNMQKTKDGANLYGWKHMRRSLPKGDIVCTCQSITCNPTTGWKSTCNPSMKWHNIEAMTRKQEQQAFVEYLPHPNFLFERQDYLMLKIVIIEEFN